MLVYRMHVAIAIMLVLDTMLAGQEAAKLPFAVPDGFVVQKVADDSLAHDAYSMTLDTRGRPVISGPGYIRTLLDGNSDDVFDQAVTWGAWPKQGAQGLWSEQGKLYWVADGGLWYANDSNMDGRADGGPIKVLSFPTGGEHDGHAIRRGPDGWWYLIVGNYAKGVLAIQNDPQAPVDRPRAGTLWRISPDFQKRGVFAHGMRNAYDFDFLPTGEVVTFDSDDERDMTLPWYRPTRVMVLAPGSDSGWVSKAWKDADYQVTMPRTLASLGRGSPTGMVVYRHTAFPEKYRDAIFVLDWTFGRVIAVYPQLIQTDASDATQTQIRVGAETFLQPKGMAGFAPTDICVEPSGSLLVCVGGRGTHGAIYRISFAGPREPRKLDTFEPAVQGESASQTRPVESIIATDDQAKDFEKILSAACPLESWSERAWLPSAERLGGGLLASAAAGVIVSPDRQPMTEVARCAALNAMVRMRYVLPPDVVRLWVNDSSPRIRLAAYRALAYGRLEDKSFERWREVLAGENQDIPDNWQKALGAGELRAKLECVGMNRWPTESLTKPVANIELEKLEQIMPVRQLWFWANAKNSQAAKMETNYEVRASQSLYRSNSVGVNGALMDALATKLSQGDYEVTESRMLEMIALLQSAMGDLRWSVPAQQDVPDSTVFDGYRSLFATTVNETVKQGWSRWLVKQARDATEKGWREVSIEATRTLAMFETSEPSVLTFCANQLTDSSHPTSDVHHLIAIARCRGTRDAQTTERTVSALLSLADKVRVNGLNTDNAWQSRLTQLFAKLLESDPNLATAMIGSPSFGTADHMIWTDGFSATLKEKARAKMALRMREIEPRQWSTTQLQFVVEKGCDDNLRSAIRVAANEPALRATAVEVLSAKPTKEDYEVFLDSLTSSDRMAWKNAWQGITQFEIGDATKESECFAVLLAKLRGSAEEPSNSSVYDRMRRVISKLGVNQVPATNSWQAFEAVIQKVVSAETWAVVQATRRPVGEWITIVNNSSSKVGDASRGKLLFAQAKCAQCHNGQTALGPDLAGIGKRFSRDDLFRSIYEPSRDISDRYRATKVLTGDGQIVIGMTVYDSVDGVTLQTADGSVVRINKDDIEEKAVATESIMPAGLLEDFSVEQVADLYAFLQTL